MVIIKEVVGYGPLMNYDSAVSRLRKKLEEEGQLSSKFGICYDISHHDSHGKYSMKYIFDYLNTDAYSKEKSSIDGSSFIRSLHRGKYTTVEDTINKLLNHAKEMNYIISAHAYFIPLFDYWESLSDDFIGEVLIPIEYI